MKIRGTRAAGMLAAVVVAATTGGCAEGQQGGGEWTGTIEDSAGVRFVRNPATALWTPSTAWTVEEELTIGSAAGDPEYQFGQVSGIGLTSDGRVLVMDQQGQHLQVFGPDGTFERTIGKAGSGPGEFGQNAGQVLVGRGDTIIVPDLGNQRVNLLLLDGGEPKSFPIEFAQGIPARWEVTESGDLVNQVRALNLPNQPTKETKDLIARRLYDGSLVDTLLTPDRGETFSFSGGAPQFHFFAPEPMWTMLSDDELCFAVNDAFRISVYDADGDLARVITLPVESTPVTEEGQQVFVEALERLWKQAGVPQQQVELLKQGISFEERYPAFLQLLRGPQRSLWAQRLVAPSDLTAEERESWNPMFSLGSEKWDVFDAEGRYLGVVEMPARFQPLGFEDDRVYGVWRDDLDVQYVKILRVTGLPTA